MLEIDKLKDRFPEGALTSMDEYARDFMKASAKPEVPPNPPFSVDPSGQIALPIEAPGQCSKDTAEGEPEQHD